MTMMDHQSPSSEDLIKTPAVISTIPFRPSNSRFGRLTPRKLLWICGAVVFAMIAIAGLVVGLVLGLESRSRASNITLTVDLGYSKYVGSNVKNGVSQWLGIRYAAAPVGELRFRAPQDPVVDGKTYQANARGPVCHQSPSTSYNPKNSEDCLFLNVFAPTDSKGAHPVFVFFQGGGFNELSSPNLDGNSLVNASDHDIVIVTFNYRVGPYGFLASEEVFADGDINAGLLDQRKVLHWIQSYIHLFGGDPGHVTIGGASAGGASIDLHMTAYDGRDDNLFHAAAAESQSFGTQLTISESQYQYDALVARVNCTNTTVSSLTCLRNLPIQTLAQNNINIPTPGGSGKSPVFMYSNVIDGNFTTNYTYALFAAGKFVQVPSIFGDDTNEGTIFTPTSINNVTEMNNFLKDNFVKLSTAELAEIDSYYPQAGTYSGKGAYWKTAANAYGEMRYNCPGIFVSSAIDGAGVESWNYHWDVLSSSNAASGYGVTHTAEVSSIWGTSSSPDSALIPTIQAYWTSFIRSKDPNTYKLSTAPSWETFGIELTRLRFGNSTAAPAGGNVDVGMETVPSDQQVRCTYLSSIGAENGQ